MENIMEFIRANSIFIIIAIVLFAFIFAVIKVVLSSIRKLSEGLAEPIELIKILKDNAPEMKEMRDSTPKSLSGMDSVYLPMIAKDFPQLNIEEFKVMAKDNLLEVFNSIESQVIDKNGRLSKDLMAMTQRIIDDQKSQGIREYFDNVNFHNIVVSRYIKEKGRVVILFQTALEYENYIMNNVGKLISGEKDHRVQARYDIQMQYIQDVSKLESHTHESSLGLNCPNCGAPIVNLGDKYCQYCGTSIVEVNLKSWFISDYRLS